jgi:hypothetical protein
MSKFTVDLGETPPSGQPAHSPLAEYAVVRERGKRRKILKVLAGAVLVLLVGGGIAGYFYWRNLKKTPQYSLALLVDAARRDDQKTIDEIVNSDAMTEDFLRQITDKAVELYGRGLPPESIARISSKAQPLIPALRDYARGALPGLIQDKSEKFRDIPFWVMAAGAGKYLDIRIEGNIAYIKSINPNRTLELIMRRSGDRWQVVGVRDDETATCIAQRGGQRIIALVAKSENTDAELVGLKSIQEVLNQARACLRQ